MKIVLKFISLILLCLAGYMVRLHNHHYNSSVMPFH
jgi:hypothetical protein